jgi:hypothetical protein
LAKFYYQGLHCSYNFSLTASFAQEQALPAGASRPHAQRACFHRTQNQPLTTCCSNASGWVE